MRALALIPLLALLGCSDDAPKIDVARDLSRFDTQRDIGADGAARDGRGDAPADLPADGPSLDSPARDSPARDSSVDARAALNVLVFSRTTGFRHGSIAAGVAAVRSIAGTRNWSVDHTEDATKFTSANLRGYNVVVWLNTTGDVLDAAQQTAFERWYRAGGGYVGVHSASDTEYSWPWYGRLIGAYFRRHPQIQQGRLAVENPQHAAQPQAALPNPWTRTDEWYDFRVNPRTVRVTVLLTIDEQSYSGGTMGSDHPIAWAQTFEGGRMFYTAMGHTNGSYSEPAFVAHLAAGIAWAAGAP